MLVNRALFYWQFIAAIALPLWIVVGRVLLDPSEGWSLPLTIVLSIVLSIAMLAVAGVTFARKSVRSGRVLERRDILVLAIWHAVIVAYGFFDEPLLAALIVIGAAVAFWNAVILLFRETKQRVKSAFALPDFPVDAGHYDAGPGRVIVIEPGQEPRER